MNRFRFVAFVLLALADLSVSFGQTPDQVLVVVNKRSGASREIGEYYLRKRGVPLANLCTIDTAPVEEITRAVYNSEVEPPVG